MHHGSPRLIIVHQGYRRMKDLDDQLQNCRDTPTKKNDLSCFKSLLVTGLRDTEYRPPSSLPYKVVPPSFEHCLVLLATLIMGGGGSQAQDHGQAPFMPKYHTVSQVLFATSCSARQGQLVFTGFLTCHY